MLSQGVIHPAKRPESCVLPEKMKLEEVQRCPPKYTKLFQEVLCDMFQCENLSQLHECDHGPIETMIPALYHARIQAKLEKGSRGMGEDRSVGKRIIKSQKAAWRNNAHLQKLVEVYKSFVFECILPQFADYGEIIYQAEPIIRIVFPGSVAPAKLHADADFWHQSNEINYWVPLVRVQGENSLWVESTPNQGDFHSLDLDGSVGEYIRFYGNQCRHYTTDNSTDSTRVSFDFRVIPASLFRNVEGPSAEAADPEAVNSLESTENAKVWCGAKPRGAKPLLEGKYYLRMSPSDEHLVVRD